MSKNRPKIWLDDTTYIYRSDYNICSEHVKWYPDSIACCRKFVTECETEWGIVHKGDTVTVTLPFYGYANNEEFYKIDGIVTRIDFNYHNEPDELQILCSHGALYTFHFRTHAVINQISTKNKEQEN